MRGSPVPVSFTSPTHQYTRRMDQDQEKKLFGYFERMEQYQQEIVELLGKLLAAQEITKKSVDFNNHLTNQTLEELEKLLKAQEITKGAVDHNNNLTNQILQFLRSKP